MMNICKLENVTKIYNEEGIVPIKDISFSIRQGDFIIIKGKSGIGKSTLLFLIGGLLKATEGKIYWNFTKKNLEISKIKDKEISSLRARNIGYVFQDSILLQSLTVEENLIFAKKISEATDNKYSKDYLLDYFGLTNKKNSLPCELSGGQRRRAMIAMNFIKNPKLILADEPTNDLDDYWVDRVIDLLQEAARNGKAVVMVTHNNISIENSVVFDLEKDMD